MSINELILKEESVLTENQKEFLKIHQDIMFIGSVIGTSLVNLAQNLKKMKDEKLYVEAGFNSFEEYSENALGLKQRQAYNYIKILDSFDEDFLHSNAKIGVSKLTLLSSLSDEEKEVIIESNNLEETSVSELKEQIQKLKQEKEDKENELAKFKEDANVELSKIKQDAEAESSKLKVKIDKLKIDLKNEKEKPAERIVETIQDPDLVSKVESLERNINLKQRLINQLQSKVSENEIANSEELTKFKFYFDNIQFEIKQMKILLEIIPEEKRDGCKKALKAIGESLC